MHKKTKSNYEKYLNDLSPDISPDSWVIGGKLRDKLRAQNKYGTALRKYDPIAFEVGFNEWGLR